MFVDESSLPATILKYKLNDDIESTEGTPFEQCKL